MESAPVTVELIRQYLRLEGEDIIRISTGKVLKRRVGRGSVINIQGRRGGNSVQYHQVKFALAHGWLPVTVDHEDGDWMNNNLSNLRAASYQQQNFNRRTPRKENKQLPRGVYLQGGRFRAQVRVGGKLHDLGYFDTPEEASRSADAFRLTHHDEFFRRRPPTKEHT